MKYFLIVLMFLVYSCRNKQERGYHYDQNQINTLQLSTTNVLNVETDSIIEVNLNKFIESNDFHFSSLIKEIKFVPLETTNESLIAKVYKIVVAETNIFIHDDFMGGGIAIFNSKGKFIRRIPNGKGPGELNRLYDFDYDNKSNQLIAYVHSFFQFYSKDGDFLETKRLPLNFYNFSIIPDGFVFKTLDSQGNEHLGDFKDFTLLIVDCNFKLRSVSLKNNDKIIDYAPITHFNNSQMKLSVVKGFSDTIYQYNHLNNQLKAKYVLNYNQKRIPEQYYKGSMDNFKRAATKYDFYYFLGDFIETDTHQQFKLNHSHLGPSYVYRDKSTGKMVGGNAKIYDPNEIPNFSYPRSASESYFISLYYSHYQFKNDIGFINKSTIISDNDKEKLIKLNEFDNPVLVFFKLKEF